MPCNASSIFVHLAVDNLGSPLGGQQQRYIRFSMIRPDGASITFTAIRPKEGALQEANSRFYFPREGRSGAFVMEFPALSPETQTFSITVNDEPLLSGINLRRAAFQSF